MDAALAEFDRQFSHSVGDEELAPSNRVTPQRELPADGDRQQDPQSRNRSESINRIPVILASKNEDQSLFDFEIQVRNLVREVEVAYWDLYVAYRDASTRIIACGDALATSSSQYQLLRSYAIQWRTSETEFATRLAALQTGRSPTNLVLQSQSARSEAQIAYYRALGEYNKATNYVAYLSGTMLADHNIMLAEGPR